MRRMERAVTLLPQPDSPTIPSVRPANRSKDVPSTARTTPSSAKKCVCRSRTERIGSAIGIGRIAQSVAEEVERQDDDDHRNGGDKKPGGEAKGLQVLRVLEHYAPGDRWWAQAKAEEGERGFTDDHRGKCQA